MTTQPLVDGGQSAALVTTPETVAAECPGGTPKQKSSAQGSPPDLTSSGKQQGIDGFRLSEDLSWDCSAQQQILPTDIRSCARINSLGGGEGGDGSKS